MTYTRICKHFLFKNNKISNKNPIKIIQNNSSRFWPETILQQQLLKLIIFFPEHQQISPTSSTPRVSMSVETLIQDTSGGSRSAADMVVDRQKDRQKDIAIM